LLGDGHGRFGGRVRETDRVKARHRALTRSYSESLAFRLRLGNAGSVRHEVARVEWLHRLEVRPMSKV